MTYIAIYNSPIGLLYLASDGSSLIGLWIEGQKYFSASIQGESAQIHPDLPVFQQTILWLDAYFAKEPLPVMPPLSPQGSPFRQSVWELLMDIPYGQTSTYGAISRLLHQRGISASAQAVGGAVGHNPISILIPCHRVLGANGCLTGYAGGIEKKKFLLNLEGVEC